MIYTSYFAKISKVKNPIAICGKSPDWYKGQEFKKLAPKYSFCKDYKDLKITPQEFIRLYYEQILNLLNAEKVKEELFSLYEGEEDITLMCFEKPDQFCHRQIVANWFSSNGIQAREVEF
jgi:hypothetical protein